MQPGADIELYGSSSSEIHSDHSSHQPNSTPRGSLVGSDHLPISSHHNESGIDVISNNSEHSGESMNKDNNKDDQTRKSSSNSSETRKNSDSRKSSENKKVGKSSDKRGNHQSKADNLGKLPVTAPKSNNNQAVKTKRSQSVPYLPQQISSALPHPQFSPPAHRICGWPINFAMQNQIPQLIPGTIITHPQFIPIQTTTTTTTNDPTGQAVGLQAQIAVAAATAAANAVGNNHKEQQQHSAHMNLAAPEFVPKSTNSVTTNPLLVPTITNIPNGRVLTSMNIRLNPSQTKNTHRNTKKLDLTGRRHTIAPQEPVKFDVKIDNQPRTLSSSPDSENNNNNNDSKPMRVQKYSRNYLMSLKESKMSLQLPNLPNIPELQIV